MTTLQAVIARYMKGEASATETVASPTWAASSAEDVVVAVMPYLSQDGGLLLVVELWRQAPKLPPPARRLAQRIVLSPDLDEPVRRSLAAAWLSAPDATVASLLRDYADVEFAWELAIVQWGQGQLGDAGVELLDGLAEPTLVRTASAAMAIALWRMRRGLLAARAADDVVTVVRDLRAVDADRLTPLLRPVLHRVWVLAAEQSIALAVDWPTAPQKGIRAALQQLGRTEPWTAGPFRKELRACRRALLGERQTRPEPARQHDPAGELRELPLTERSVRVKELWAAGGELLFPVVTGEGRRGLVGQLDAQLVHLDEVRLHKNESYNASGDQWHDNPGFLALEQEENGLLADIGRRREELQRVVEITLEPRPTARVSIGSVVSYREMPDTVPATPSPPVQHCEIVGLGEADVGGRRVSYRSPLAVALQGAAPGDQTKAKTPGGQVVYEVVALHDSVPS